MSAIDRAGIVKAVYGGRADLMNAEIPPATGALYDPNVPNKYPYEPARAKALLAAAGWKAGSGGTLVKGKTRFAFTLLFTRGDAQGEQMATIIQQDLANVGISVQLQGMENSVLIGSHLNKDKFDAAIGYWFNYAFPDNLFQFGCHQTVAEAGQNYGFYCNPTVEKLLDLARTTINPTAQKRVFNQLQVMMNQDLPYLWLNAARTMWVMDKNIRGYQDNAIDTDVWSAWRWSLGQ
jgi:peptide/nickel transport system substrate-binding protein